MRDEAHPEASVYSQSMEIKESMPVVIAEAEKLGYHMRSAYISTKDKAEHSMNAAESSPDEYASDRIETAVDRGTHETLHQADKVGRWGVRTTKDNAIKAKDGVQKFKEKRAEQALKKQSAKSYSSPTGKGSIKTVEQTEKTVRQSEKSAGKKTIKTAEKGAVKTAQKSVKTAEKTAKTTIKTTQQAAKAAQKTAQATVKASQRAAQMAKATAKAVAAGVKAAVKATIAAVKAIISGTKALIAAIAAGGWIAVVVIIVI